MSVHNLPHEFTFSGHCVVAVLSRVKPDLVVYDQKELVSHEVCDFLVTLAIKTIMAFDELDVELARLVRVVISVSVQVLRIHTQHLLVVKVDGPLRRFIGGEERCLASVLSKTKFFPRAYVGLNSWSCCAICTIFHFTPREVIEDQLSILGLKDGLRVTVVGCETHGEVESVVVVEHVFLRDLHVVNRREHVDVASVDQYICLLHSVGQSHDSEDY